MEQVLVVGVLNVTPDSYVPQSRVRTLEEAVERAQRMAEEGADIIEIGGESTGPNSKEVSAQEELDRTIIVIKEIKKSMPKLILSIDTYKATVAAAAIAEGVEMVNDVTAGRADAELLDTVARSQASIVLMYAKDPTPRTTVEPRRYDDVIATIHAFLAKRIAVALEAGIPLSRIIVDPGLGHFVSGLPEYSFEILSRLAQFQDLGCPLFVSPSRKSFLAGPQNLPVSERLPGTIAASVVAALHGAQYIRTHDVLAVRRALDVARMAG
jgi:dihydropteroate synthase